MRARFCSGFSSNVLNSPLVMLGRKEAHERVLGWLEPDVFQAIGVGGVARSACGWRCRLRTTDGGKTAAARQQRRSRPPGARAA
jgi:hypothetical protein